jgi:hypothetical protein
VIGIYKENALRTQPAHGMFFGADLHGAQSGSGVTIPECLWCGNNPWEQDWGCTDRVWHVFFVLPLVELLLRWCACANARGAPSKRINCELIKTLKLTEVLTKAPARKLCDNSV